jgi:hypothetical protein
MGMGMGTCVGIGGHLGGQAEATAERGAVRRQAAPQRAAHLLARATLEHRPHALESVDLPCWRQARLLRRVERADTAPERLCTQAQPQQLGAISGCGGAMAAAKRTGLRRRGGAGIAPRGRWAGEASWQPRLAPEL